MRRLALLGHRLRDRLDEVRAHVPDPVPVPVIRPRNPDFLQVPQDLQDGLLAAPDAQ